MELKKLTLIEITNIYHEHFVHDFPKVEQKPLKVLEKLHHRGFYPCYGLFDKHELVAYGFFCNAPHSSCLVLDYFAVCSNKRNKGYGSHFLKLVTSLVKNKRGIICEIESLSASNDETSRMIRARRLAFYRRNGAHLTKVKAWVFDVEFNIVYLPCVDMCDNETIYKELNKAYLTMMPLEMYESQVRFKFLK